MPLFSLTRISTLWLLLQCALLLCFAADLKRYEDGEDVPIYASKIGPYSNPQETYFYYELPFCIPEKMVHKHMSIGEVVSGERSVKTAHQIRFNKPSGGPTVLCNVDLDRGQMEKLKAAVERNYYFEFEIDELPVRGFIGKVEETSIVPHRHKIVLYHHQHFSFLIDKNNHIVAVNFSVGTVEPIVLSDLPLGEAEVHRIEFTYEVTWQQSDLSADAAMQVREGMLAGGLRSNTRFEVHWLSIFNSLFLVVLLVSFSAATIGHTIRRDLMSSPQLPKDASQSNEMDDLVLSSGWKAVRTDVFRPPKRRSLLASIVGVGFQLTCLAIGLLAMMTLEAFEANHHHNAMSAFVILYAMTSSIAGFVSGSTYKEMGGKRWHFNSAQTAALFTGPVAIVWILSTFIALGYNSTRALPWTTVVLLVAIWGFIGLPLTMVGSWLANRSAATFEAPCRTRQIPREIPPARWYSSTPIQWTIGGILCFSAIAVELYYLYSAVFCRHPYDLYGVLLIAFCVLLAVAGSASVALTFCRMASENHRWWWASALNPAASAIFFLIYSVYFYYKHCRMSGLLQTFLYAGYCCTGVYAVALMLASVGFLCSRRFTVFVYSQLKAD